MTTDIRQFEAAWK